MVEVAGISVPREEEVKEAIEKFIFERGLNITEFAEFANISRESLYRWFSGEHSITYKHLDKILYCIGELL